MANKDEGPAVEKRIKISKSQRTILAITLVTSLIVGCCIVLAIHFGKYISFNNKVIKAKDTAISNYETTIKNVGICSAPKGKKYTLAEIKACNPNSLSSSSLSGTLRYNVMEVMSKNEDLETVARESEDDCTGSDGKKIDYQAKYEAEEDEEKRAYYLGMVKMCSSLRVIPDALPAQENVEALLASLNQIFIVSNWDPEALSPSDEEVESEIEGASIIPVSLAVESNPLTTMTVLQNIERSIRTFDITTATVEWQGLDKLSLQAQAEAYYLNEAGVVEATETVYASKEARKLSSSGGNS